MGGKGGLNELIIYLLICACTHVYARVRTCTHVYARVCTLCPVTID